MGSLCMDLWHLTKIMTLSPSTSSQISKYQLSIYSEKKSWIAGSWPLTTTWEMQVLGNLIGSKKVLTDYWSNTSIMVIYYRFIHDLAGQIESIYLAPFLYPSYCEKKDGFKTYCIPKRWNAFMQIYDDRDGSYLWDKELKEEKRTSYDLS